MSLPRCAVCGRPRLVDAFSGEGGAGVGYQRAGFCVTPVDLVRSRLKRYPVDCAGVQPVRGDAVEYIVTHGREYAAGHGSPTCTGYSRGTAGVPDRFDKYDRLIPATRAAFEAVDLPYVIENVEDAKGELVTPLTLCWTHFHRPGSVQDRDGTPVWMRRHRLFESNVFLLPVNECTHPARMQCAGAYSGARRDPDEAKEREGGYVPHVSVLRDLLGTPWMSERGCQLSIPPVYTEWIGSQLIEHLEAVAA